MSLNGSPVYHYGHVATYASRTVVHESCAIRIDPAMPLDRAALIGCSVMTGVGAVINTAAVPAGASMAVFGVGGVGLNVVQGGAMVAAHPIIAVDLRAARLEHARAVGATHAIDASRQNPAAAIRAITGRGADFTFVAVGATRPITQALEALAPGGTCVLIGVPLGIVAAHKPMFYTVMRPVLDLMQTVPTFVYLIPTLTLFGLGVVPGLISTVVFAIAAPIRLTYLGIRDVPDELMDAGKAFGCSRRQLLSRIELPHAMPSIAAGITQCIMLSLSMVVIAALVGADGLGKPVVNALNTADIALGFEAGLAIVLLAIMLDRICKQPEAKVGGDA